MADTNGKIPGKVAKLIKSDIISAKVAQEQVQLFLDYYNFDPDTDAPPMQVVYIQTALKRLEKAVRGGHLEIMELNGGLQITQKLQRPPGNINELNYEEIRGKHKLAMKNKSEADNYSRIYALVGSLTGVQEAGIQALHGLDLSVVECLGAVFLAL